MSTNPEQDPREVLGDPIWDTLGQYAEPVLSEDFDDRFRTRMETPNPAPRGRWPWQVAGAAVAAVALAAGLSLTVLQPAEPAGDDLDLYANLDVIENLDLLQNMDLLLAWNGEQP